MQDDNDSKSLGATGFALASSIVRLEPGPLARLRRMDVSGPGEGDFWKLAVKHNLSPPERWLLPVHLMALLTPKGSPSSNKPLHDSRTPFGKALAESGYPEIRLMRFLSLPSDRRGGALERMSRWIASGGHFGVDCRDICYLHFVSGPRPLRHLAETYYQALDCTAAEVDNGKENNP